VEFMSQIQVRYGAPERGEVHEYLQGSPTITISLVGDNLLLQPKEQKSLRVTFRKHSETNGEIPVALRLSSPGWKVTPETISLSFEEVQEVLSRTMEITHSVATEPATLRFAVFGKKLN